MQGAHSALLMSLIYCGLLERGIVPVFPCGFDLPHSSGDGARDGGGGSGSTDCIRLETSSSLRFHELSVITKL